MFHVITGKAAILAAVCDPAVTSNCPPAGGGSSSGGISTTVDQQAGLGLWQ